MTAAVAYHHVSTTDQDPSSTVRTFDVRPQGDVMSQLILTVLAGMAEQLSLTS
jgi:hypothetical protein